MKSIILEIRSQLVKNNGMIKDNFICSPNPDDIYEWYFLVFGLLETPYEGGFYLGRLKFPNEYPMKAPAISLLTETGRFSVNCSICLSISEHHPETWSPVWRIGAIILGLISFMVTENITYGSINTTVKHKKELASKSKDLILKHKIF